jgi:hypothetical protein
VQIDLGLADADEKIDVFLLRCFGLHDAARRA